MFLSIYFDLFRAIISVSQLATLPYPFFLFSHQTKICLEMEIFFLLYLISFRYFILFLFLFFLWLMLLMAFFCCLWLAPSIPINGRDLDDPSQGAALIILHWAPESVEIDGALRHRSNRENPSLSRSLSLSLALCEHLPPTWLQLSIKPNGSAPILQNPVGTQSTTPRAAEIKIWLFRWNVCDSISIDPLFKAVGIQSRMNFWLIKTRIDAGTILPAITGPPLGCRRHAMSPHNSAQLCDSTLWDLIHFSGHFHRSTCKRSNFKRKQKEKDVDDADVLVAVDFPSASLSWSIAADIKRHLHTDGSALQRPPAAHSNTTPHFQMPRQRQKRRS